MKLKELIDSNTFMPVLQQLQQRTWLMHWGLYVFFNHENGRNLIIDNLFQDRCAFLVTHEFRFEIIRMLMCTCTEGVQLIMRCPTCQGAPCPPAFSVEGHLSGRTAAEVAACSLTWCLSGNAGT